MPCPAIPAALSQPGPGPLERVEADEEQHFSGTRPGFPTSQSRPHSLCRNLGFAPDQLLPGYTSGFPSGRWVNPSGSFPDGARPWGLSDASLQGCWQQLCVEKCPTDWWEKVPNGTFWKQGVWGRQGSPQGLGRLLHM